MKKLFSLLLALLLCASVSLAQADALSLDALTSDWLDIDYGDEVCFALSAELDTLQPYGERTMELFNTALKNLCVSARFSSDMTMLDVCVAGESVASFTELMAQTGSELTTPLLLNRYLSSRDSVVDTLAKRLSTDEDTQAPSFDLLAAIEEAEECYTELTDAILPYAVEKAANYTIKQIGPSKWSRIARLTPEQGEELSPLIGRLLGCGMDEDFRDTLMNMQYAKGFIVGLYQSAEGGSDMAVYIKGDVTLADGTKRSLSYQWAFIEKDDTRTDTYKFVWTKTRSPKDDREILATLKRKLTQEDMSVKGECTAKLCDAVTLDTLNITTKQELSGQKTAQGHTVQGTVTETVKTTNGKSSTTCVTSVTPDLLLSFGEIKVLSGSMGVSLTENKTEKFKATLLFSEDVPNQLTDPDLSRSLYTVAEDEPEADDNPYLVGVGKPPIGFTHYSVPTTLVGVNVDTLGDEPLAALMDEMLQALSGRLIIAFAKLSPEDAAIIRDNLSDTDYGLLLRMTDGL